MLLGGFIWAAVSWLERLESCFVDSSFSWNMSIGEIIEGKLKLPVRVFLFKKGEI